MNDRAFNGHFKRMARFCPMISDTLRLLVGIGLLSAVAVTQAANVSLTSSDPSGTSSFNSAGRWSNGAPPGATNDYFTSTFILRSPANADAYTFGGGSLTISAGGRLLMKGTGGQILTVPNLIMNGGLADYANANTDYNSETLAGNITLAAGTTNYFGALSGSSGSETLIITAAIGGSGHLQIAGPTVNAGADNGTVVFAAPNTYTGNTTIAGGTLALTGNGSIVSTNIAISAGAALDVASQTTPVLAAGQNLFGAGLVRGGLTVSADAKVYPGADGMPGTLTFSNTLTMATGATFHFDVSSSSSTGNDTAQVNGALVLNNTTFHLRALSGAPNLDTSADYVLLTAGSISGSVNPTVVWTGTPPDNAAEFGMIVSGNAVKLHHLNAEFSATATATPATILTNRSTLLQVTVRPAANPVSTGIAVTADLAPIGGSPSQVFYDDGTHGDLVPGDQVFSFAATAVSRSTPGLNLLSVTVTDAQARMATTQIPLTARFEPYLPLAFLPVSGTASAGALPLAASGIATPIYYSPNDATVVGLAAQALRDDVQRVTGLLPVLSSNSPAATFNAVFIGTIGSSLLIDALIAAGKIDVSAIEGHWEAYTATVVTNPIAGVNRALVIAGSDRRGTAFGVFGLSEALGVSPWYWFADVPVAPKAALYVAAGTYTEPSPAVKYRGIFINDEDWGMEPWARLTFDPSGDIGPTTYARVFELLLRLHANYIWPGMHPTTLPYYTIPGNKKVADDYAIVVGTSHHEPMARNTEEYDPNVLGPYNYWINRAAISNFWDLRVVELTNSENVYTIGMRGLTDDGIISPSGTSTQQKADKLQNEIIPDQRAMIAKHLNPNPALVPQIFVPYKEALTLYQTGLQLPDDVTLVWVDDNHGYIRQLSTTAEQARSGGSGVYYHQSYWGVPRNYLWLCTTPPAMTWSEMSKAWDYDARRIWIVNVGDIKPGEIGMEFFLRLARDPEAFRDFDQHAYFERWAARTFGETHAGSIASMLQEYFRLNIIVRPEHLDKTTSGFSLVDKGDEAQRRLDEFAALVNSAETVYAQLTPAQRTAFYQMILYPIRGSKLVNEKVLLAERSRLWATQQRSATGNLAAAAQAAHNKLQSENTFYNQTNAGGKWNGMITWTTSGAASSPFTMPTLGSYAAPSSAGLGVAIEGSAAVLNASTAGLLPTFNPIANQSYFIDVFNTGTSPLSWAAQASAPWITLSQINGTADARIQVGIDWAQAPHGNEVTGSITIQGAGATRVVNVRVFNPASLNPATLPSAVENNGVVSIEAEDFISRQDSTNGVGWRKLGRATASYDGMTILPTTAASLNPAALSADAPSLTYEFHTFNAGPAVLKMACLPTQSINAEHPGCRYAISLNGDAPQVVDISTLEFSSTWSANVVRATAYGTTTHTIATPGLQTVKVWMIDPGVVLDKLTVELPVGPRYEAENLEFSTASAYHPFTEAAASGGGAMSLDATAVGQSITFAVPNVAAGVFDLTVRAKTWNNRGIGQVSMGNTVGGPFTNVGSALDFYSAAASYTDLASLRLTNSIAGTKYIKFTVTGRNAASTGYLIVLDSLTLTPVIVPPVASGAVKLASSFSNNTLNLLWPSGFGWRLQTQTNNLMTGLGTNWVHVTDGLVFSTNITIDPVCPAAFFRLSYP